MSSADGFNTMKDVLDQARNGDMVTALAAGTVAVDVMSSARSDTVYNDAAAALAAAFLTIKDTHLASHPHLAHAVADHAKRIAAL
jgi:hypothetical protein